MRAPNGASLVDACRHLTRRRRSALLWFIRSDQPDQADPRLQQTDPRETKLAATRDDRLPAVFERRSTPRRNQDPRGGNMVWAQIYDPFHNMFWSTLAAAVPVVVLLGLLAFHVRAHLAAVIGLVSALVVAIWAFGMPAKMAGLAAAFGAAFGLLPIGWIVLNIIFLHRLTEENGSFQVLQDSIANLTDDRRLQLLFIAFSFGAFFEGAAGFGTPVAVCAAILIGLGFSPLAASGLALIANTAPVAYGALGSPVIALSAVTGLDLFQLSGMIGRQLPLFSLIVPFWLLWAF